MTNEQHIENLKKLKSFHNGSYGADIDRAIEALEQEPWEDEYIKVPKRALKYRTAGMVAYNVAWLREHWQMEMDIVCGVKPCEDAISRQAAISTIYDNKSDFKNDFAQGFFADRIRELSPVNPQPKTGHWIPVSERLPEKSDRYLAYIVNRKDDKLQYIMTCDYLVDGYWNWFPDAESASDNVIAWMPLPKPYEPQEERNKE